MSKLFLSHTNVDKPFVRKLAADLRNNGHTVWIDEAVNSLPSQILERSLQRLLVLHRVLIIIENNKKGALCALAFGKKIQIFFWAYSVVAYTIR